MEQIKDTDTLSAKTEKKHEVDCPSCKQRLLVSVDKNIQQCPYCDNMFLVRKRTRYKRVTPATKGKEKKEHWYSNVWRRISDKIKKDYS